MMSAGAALVIDCSTERIVIPAAGQEGLINLPSF